MKTIAITIDPETLDRVDRWVDPRVSERRNRSVVFRRAVQEYLRLREAAEREERERAVIRKNRARLRRQAAQLVHEQAKP